MAIMNVLAELHQEHDLKVLKLLDYIRCCSGLQQWSVCVVHVPVHSEQRVLRVCLWKHSVDEGLLPLCFSPAAELEV